MGTLLSKSLDTGNNAVASTGTDAKPDTVTGTDADTNPATVTDTDTKHNGTDANPAAQSGGEPRITIDIFGSEKKNSKGFLINDIKITPQNLNSTFSSKDQVEHFLTNVFDYVKNSNLPEDQQEPIRNFFHSYKEIVNIKPTSGEEPAIDEKSTTGGCKKKRSRNRKPKARHRKTKKH